MAVLRREEVRRTEKKETDILVVGGGSAGCFAAIAAARSGARVLLLEKNGMLGGTATVGRVNFPGLFHAWGKRIIGGPAWEAIERCVQRGGAVLPPFPYKSEKHYYQQIHVDVFTYAYVLEEMCAESGAEVRCHVMPFSVRETSEGVCVRAATKDGEAEFSARILVDSTGDADLIRMAGLPCETRPHPQPATLIHDLGGYDLEAIDRAAFERFVLDCVADGRFSPEDSQGEEMWKCLCEHRIHFHIDAPLAQTSQGRSDLERRARAALWRIVSTLRSFSGLEGLTVTSFATECGVRETVRIVGMARQTAEDYLSGRRFADSVCYSFYPIDLHEPNGIRQIFLEDGVLPSIRYGSLIPQGSGRILAAGRCISSDVDTNSAIRVQATCMATGQVAGVAAALCSDSGQRVGELPLQDLRKALQALGAILPEEV